MVAVDERGIHGIQVREHLEAQRPVEDVAAREGPLVLRGVELRGRIDHVELGSRSEALEHLHGRLAAERTDLDDPLGAGGLEHRCDGDIPEREHDGA